MKAGKFLAAAIVVMTAAASTRADEGAQANIVRAAPDPNGVDLVTGGLYVSEPGFSAPGAGKLLNGRRRRPASLSEAQREA